MKKSELLEALKARKEFAMEKYFVASKEFNEFRGSKNSNLYCFVSKQLDVTRECAVELARVIELVNKLDE